MPLTLNIVNQLLPVGRPSNLEPWETANASVIYDRIKPEPEQNEILVRSYLWTQWLLRNALSWDVLGPVRQTMQLSCGFIEIDSFVGLSWPATDLPKVNGFVFGVHAFVRALDPFIGLTVFPRVVSGIQVALVIEPTTRIELHNSPPAPNMQGSWQSTCWAQDPQKSNGWSHGILTCRHGFTPPTRNLAIPLTPTLFYKKPTSAVLADFDQCSIDAAVMEIPASDWPKNVSKLYSSGAIAPGTQVKFMSNGRSVASTVLRTFLLPSYFGNLVGQRIFVDQVGVHGDSGTLLQDTSSNEGIGIYMGTIPGSRNRQEGLFQSLQQAVDYFKLDLYL